MNKGLDGKFKPLNKSDFKKAKHSWAAGWKVKGNSYKTHDYCYKDFDYVHLSNFQ